MAKEDVKLLQFWASPFGMRVLIALDLKGVEFELLYQDILTGKSQVLLDSNPVHKMVPVLIHNGRAVAESAIIVQYVDEAWPSTEGKDLLPKDPYEKAVALFWGDFVDKKLFEVARLMVKTAGEELEKVKAQTTENLMLLEKALGNMYSGGPFFAGGSPGYVDVMMAPFIHVYPCCEAMGSFEFGFEEKMPHIYAWIKAVESSSMMKSMLIETQKLMDYILGLRKKIIHS